MSIQNVNLKIVDKKQIAEDTFSIYLQRLDGGNFDFASGQFANLLVAPMVRRSYSIASLPGQDTLELIADTVIGGPGSQFFEKAQAGDEVGAIFPLGNFVYKSADKAAYFLATGTGVVPFLSMIKYALEVEKTQRKLFAYIGFRYEKSIFGKDVLDNLKNSFPNFDYLLTVTQPSPEWQGTTGRITNYYEQQITETDIDAYVCGSKQMIDDVKLRLTNKGIPQNQIYFEQFY